MTEIEDEQVQMQMQRGQMDMEALLRDWMRSAEQATGIQANILIVTLVILLAAILGSVNLECRQLIVNGMSFFISLCVGCLRDETMLLLVFSSKSDPCSHFSHFSFVSRLGSNSF